MHTKVMFIHLINLHRMNPLIIKEKITLKLLWTKPYHSSDIRTILFSNSIDPEECVILCKDFPSISLLLNRADIKADIKISKNIWRNPHYSSGRYI